MLIVQLDAEDAKLRIQALTSGLEIATPRVDWNWSPMTWKIEKHCDGQRTTIRLIGRMQLQHLQALQTLIDESSAPITLDLDELMLVDVEAVCFLGRCQNDGVSLLHCSRYIKDWIAKERDAGK